MLACTILPGSFLRRDRERKRCPGWASEALRTAMLTTVDLVLSLVSVEHCR